MEIETKVKITLNDGTKIKLNSEEARELYDTLHTLYGNYSWPYWTYNTWPTVYGEQGNYNTKVEIT